MRCAMGFYNGSVATQGIEGKYYFAKYFENVADVCTYTIEHGDKIKKDCMRTDEALMKSCPEPQRMELFSQAVRGYYANTQLTEAKGKPYYSVLEGCFHWRNTMDLAADHLPWELYRNPCFFKWKILSENCFIRSIFNVKVILYKNTVIGYMFFSFAAVYNCSELILFIFKLSCMKRQYKIFFWLYNYLYKYQKERIFYDQKSIRFIISGIDSSNLL